MNDFTQTFADQVKIQRLKREAKRHRQAHADIASSYPCGLALAQHINPDLVRHADAFNVAMDQLEQLDPNCPKGIRL